MFDNDPLLVEYNHARTRFYQAHHNFENASPSYVDAAIAELSAAEAKMDAILREIKARQQLAV